MNYSGTDNLEVMAEAVNYNEYLVKLVLAHSSAGDRILDFGAGIGTFSKCIAKRGHEVLCVEPDPKQASLITESGLTAYNNLSHIENNSIDYLYSLNVLEHIENDQDIMNEIYNKIKPGGRLLVYVPAFQLLYSSMDTKVGHYRRYTRRSLTNVARRAGFEVLKTRYVDSAGFFATLLYKFFGNSSGDLNTRALIVYDRLVFPMSRVADRLSGLFFGKNVFLVGVKREHAAI
ncbi:SAM-dependent methyltransferase [Paraburkholderia sp. GAS448]|uniref:class I SAM-dependent methyltransferase n=1 Tax=Paraburkholderia sp. GAS448 TaxID=3035136 RepID=UPI003D199ADE